MDDRAEPLELGSGPLPTPMPVANHQLLHRPCLSIHLQDHTQLLSPIGRRHALSASPSLMASQYLVQKEDLEEP